MAERDNLTAHKSKRHHFLKRSLHFFAHFFLKKKIYYAESHSKGPTPYLSKEYSTQCA